MAQNVKYERLQDELGLLKGDLAQFDADNRSLKSQLDEAKEEIGTVIVKAISEYQSSAEMATLRQTIQDEAFEEAVESFAYNIAISHPDWDLSYLGNRLVVQIAEWRAESQAGQPLIEERLAAAASLAHEVQEALAPPPDGPHEQVIEGDQEPEIRPAESNASLE